MEQMLTIAELEGIMVVDYPLERPLLGIYLCGNNNPPVIGLSKFIGLDNERRCIMAEELGHHFTSAGQCLPKKFYSYNERVNITRAEYKALKWAANYLMPEHDLLDTLKSGIEEIWELAEHFNVTEEFVVFRMRLFGARNIA